MDILHPLDQPFTSSSGAAILQNLSFSQTRTNFSQVQCWGDNGVAISLISLYRCQMLLAAQSVFAKSRQRRNSRSGTMIDQLLLILSDGRGVFADGAHVCVEIDSCLIIVS